MKVIKAIHTAYGVIVFAILFFVFFVLLLIPILFPKYHKLVGIFNRWWATLLFFFIGIPFSRDYRFKPGHNNQYIFCPNHFSYLDIPTIGLNIHDTIFVGKNDMEKIPLFGFMYSKLHITVDRTKLKSRYSTMMRTFQAIDEGKSLVIFPEGGIVTEHDPVMGEFKNGAFRASIEKQIPIVPVTIPYNWIILPADKFLLSWRPVKLIFHEPIDPTGYTMKDMDAYKERVRNIIEQELKRLNA
jgi:1-acyl-sn-glycerol-3-phosphate acyltransferase